MGDTAGVSALFSVRIWDTTTQSGVPHPLYSSALDKPAERHLDKVLPHLSGLSTRYPPESGETLRRYEARLNQLIARRATYLDVRVPAIERWFAAQDLFPEIAERVWLTPLNERERPGAYEARLKNRTGAPPNAAALKKLRTRFIADECPPRPGELHDEWELRLGKTATARERAEKENRRIVSDPKSSPASRLTAAKALLPEDLVRYADGPGNRIGAREDIEGYTTRLRGLQRDDQRREAIEAEAGHPALMSSHPVAPPEELFPVEPEPLPILYSDGGDSAAGDIYGGWGSAYTAPDETYGAGPDDYGTAFAVLEHLDLGG